MEQYSNPYGFATAPYQTGNSSYTNPSAAFGTSSTPGTSGQNQFQGYNVPAPVTGAATLAQGSHNSAPSGAAMQNANTGWQNAFTQEQNIANQIYSGAGPSYQQSYTNLNNINYNPYLNASNQAGNDITALSGIAGNQMNAYGNQANQAQTEQSNLYNAGNQLYSQAFNNNNAQYNQTNQQLMDQVNAGQALRGLGNSAQGAQEFNNTESNFNIGWNAQQLQNEQMGLQGMSAASNAAANQGNYSQAMRNAQLQAGQNQAQYLQQGSSLPLQAQQYAYDQPAQNAQQYSQELSGMQGNYSGITGQATSYLNQGMNAQQQNANFNANQTSSELGMLGSVLGNSSVQSGLGDAAGAIGDAIGWIVCTELNKQGRLPTRWYVSGSKRFASYDDRGKQGYYYWAIPCVKHLRKYPDSKLSKMLEWVFNHRAEYIAAQNGVRGARKTFAGFMMLTSMYVLCWVLSRTVATKPIDWTSIYKKV